MGSRQLVLEPRSGPPRPGAGAGAGAERDDSASWRSVALSAPSPARDAAGCRSHCRVGQVSSLAARADGSRRSAATARRCTSSRASGSAMASSSQGLQPGEEKTHILSVLSSSRLAAGALGGPAAYLLGFFRALRCAGGVAGSRACPAVFAALPAARRSNHYAGGADHCRRLSGQARPISQWVTGPPSACVTTAAGQHIAIRRTRARGERPGRPGSTWTTTEARATAGATTIKPAKGWFYVP